MLYGDTLFLFQWSPMPKMKKEKSDEIVRLLNEGYTNVEIAKKTHISEGTVSRLRGRLKKSNDGVAKVEVKSESSASINVLLSGESLKKLGAIQVVLGCNTLDEAVDLLHSDVPKMMSYKFKAYPDFHGTPVDVFKEVVETSRLFSEVTDPRNRETELQSEVLAKMGMSWFIKGLYRLE